MALIRRAKNGCDHISSKNKSIPGPSFIRFDSVRTGLVDDGNVVRCLDYIHTELFSNLEVAMCGLIEALMDFEEICK